MIRYALVCAREHEFEAWFRDSGAFDNQSQEGRIDCPRCGSAEVRKAMMAPAIRRKTARSRGPDGAVAAQPRPPDVAPAGGTPLPVVLQPPAAPQGPGLDDDRFRQMRALLRELHTKLKATAENVGPAFPEEARKIHNGEADARPIYGTAGSEDVRALMDDGIEILPLPPLPDDSN